MYNRYSNNRIRYTRHPNNRTKIEKRQTKLPFTKIILIILAILFIVLGIYGIKKLMETNDPPQTQEDINKLSNSEIISPQINQFKSDFQKDINKVLRSFQYSQDFEYFLPETISKVCFEDGEFENMYFVPSVYGGDMLKNIDLEKTLKDLRSICFDVYNGRVYMTLKKGYYGSKVTLVEKEYEKQEEVIFLCNGTWSQEYYWEGFYECDGSAIGCNISSCLCGDGFSPDLIGGCDLDDGNITYICNGTWEQEYYWEGVYECDGIVIGCNISSCLCGNGFSPDLVGGCDLDDENITYICNGTWEQEYYWEGFYECDGSAIGCNISSCLCGGEFSPNLRGGCVSFCNGTWKQEYYEEGVYECDGSASGCDVNFCLCGEEFSSNLIGGCSLDYIEIPEPVTTVLISRSIQLAKANMESSIFFIVSDIDGRDVDVFFEDVSGIGFEFMGKNFGDIRSGRNLLQIVVVPEAAYPGKYIIRVGAIPSSLVPRVKTQNGGSIPPLSTFPELGFGIDDITLDINGINYEPVVELSVWQDDNTEGTISNPFHSGGVRVSISVIEDSGYIGPYMSSWDYRKISGDFCDSDSPYTRLQLFATSAVNTPFSLLVPRVRTRVSVEVTGFVRDGIFSIPDTRTIYVEPEEYGCYPVMPSCNENTVDGVFDHPYFQGNYGSPAYCVGIKDCSFTGVMHTSSNCEEEYDFQWLANIPLLCRLTTVGDQLLYPATNVKKICQQTVDGFVWS